ncbi:MAG TPA: glycosyltransferase [Gemmatimonadaceae bacterium]|nr:glycosyltransferase [Gemmatimonadaceae bacterium]
MPGMIETAQAERDSDVLVLDPMRGRPCSIVHVLDPGLAGGLETVVHALACGHAAAGHHVTVLTPSDTLAARRFLDRFAGTAVHTECVAVHGRGYASERAAVRSALARRMPDVVHTHGLRSDVVDAGAARGLGLATITTVHGYTDATVKLRLYGLLQRGHLHRFDAVIAVSSPLARRLAPYVPGARLHVIPNGWVPEHAAADRAIARSGLGVHDERMLIGWVGRLAREKAPDVAIAAFARVAQVAERMGVELAVIGDGPERSRVEELARQLGIAPHVRFHGTRPDAPTLMTAFDALVLSSRREGTPMVLLEAMAVRTPIIATRVGGVPDVLSEREALLVPRDDPRALGSALLNVLLDRDGALARAERAAEVLATRYDGARWLDRYTAHYRRLRQLTQRRRTC